MHSLFGTGTTMALLMRVCNRVSFCGDCCVGNRLRQQPQRYISLVGKPEPWCCTRESQHITNQPCRRQLGYQLVSVAFLLRRPQTL